MPYRQMGCDERRWWFLAGATATVVAATLLLMLVPGVEPVAACRISEYPCRNNRCVRLDRYCDGHDDCGDNSDEPPYCTGTLISV